MTDESSGNRHFESHITVTTAGISALEHLDTGTSLSKQKLKKAMSNGAVWLESSLGIHRIRRAKKILSVEDKLHLYYDETIQETVPEKAVLIADEGEYSIWNKPYGMYSQGTKWGDHCTLYRYAEKHLTPQRPAFPVHRLDRAASGLMILAHSKTMAATFSALFKDRKVQKRYKALVEGELDNIDLPYTISSNIDDRPAISKIIALEIHGENTMVTIEIETGRKHQIRKHLSELGYPIVGDRLYGTGKSEENLQLQSNYLRFDCPLTNNTKEYSLEQAETK
jgi:tRNA pseudouridine32 synthase/23S rRNA pseudouridine746 synthase